MAPKWSWWSDSTVSPRATALLFGAITIAWTLRHSAVDGAIVGFRCPDQVDPILGAANLELDDNDIATIKGRV